MTESNPPADAPGEWPMYRAGTLRDGRFVCCAAATGAARWSLGAAG